jgi:hypothetical protein
MNTTLKKTFFLFTAIAVLAVGVAPSQAATKATTPKPAVSGAPSRGGFGGGQNSAAFAKYTACLAKAGIKLPAFGGGRGFGGGTRPTGAPATGTTPRPRPTFSLTPTQQKAFTACAALRPSFGGAGGAGRNFAPGARPTAATKGSKTAIAPKAAPAPKKGTSAAYIACLNTQGIPVQTAADVKGLDNQNTKVIAAMKACAGK